MTFGLRNAAQSFQRFIDGILRDLPYCFPYIDDILVASSDAEEHVTHFRELFNRLRQHNLMINVDKCILRVSEVKFLGHIVSSAGINPLPTRVQTIVDFKKPIDVCGLRRFVGMCNFYRRFLPHSAERQMPLQRLLGPCKKNDKTKLHWTMESETAFNKLKEDLKKATLLAFPNENATLSLMTHASDKAIGASIQQKVKGNWQPLGFFSRKLSSTEQKYSTYDRELLATYAAIRHFR